MTPHPLALRDAATRPPPTARPADIDAAVRRAHGGLRCVACRRDVTDRDAAIAVHGAHDHHFVNPHGHAFHVGIFKDAPGCALVGPPTDFYSWFPGLAWRFAVCGGCHAHLGWAFGAAPEFFALILDRLCDAGE